jgi:hypothetical protein
MTQILIIKVKIKLIIIYLIKNKKIVFKIVKVRKD